MKLSRVESVQNDLDVCSCLGRFFLLLHHFLLNFFIRCSLSAQYQSKKGCESENPEQDESLPLVRFAQAQLQITSLFTVHVWTIYDLLTAKENSRDKFSIL